MMETRNTPLQISNPDTSRISEQHSSDSLPLYNSRIIKNWVEYLKRYYPDIDIDTLLKHANIKDYELDDEGHWLTQKQIDGFHHILASKTDDAAIARAVGRFTVSSRASGALKQYLFGFINPETAYSVLEKLNAHFSRGVKLKTKSVGRNRIEARATLMPNVIEKPYQCLNRLGALEAVAKIFTGKYAKIEHPTCIHQGGDCCLYVISWENTRPFFWKQIRNYFAVFCIIACILCFELAPANLWPILISACLLSVISLSLYTEHVEKKELLNAVTNQGDVADRLIDQINVSYNNALLIREIGQATSSILDINQLLVYIVDSLEKRLDFDRGMIMLADPERTRLKYTIGYGYSREQRDYIEKSEFHLDNPNSRGTFVVSFRKQIPILINDIREVEKEYSPRSAAFAKQMGTLSFVCVPIVFKEESMGILVVDNIYSKRVLSQSDMSLLMGIAPQIAISINNAMAYRKIRESEERFRSLSETAPDIIYTVDTRGVFTYVNPAWERILGYRVDETLGKYFIDFVRKEDIRLTIDTFKKVRNGRQTIRGGVGLIPHKNGSDRFFSVSSAPNFDAEGRVVGAVGVFKDITDLKLSEAKLQKSYMKLKTAMDSTIETISKIVESRDPFTSGHQERVARLATAIANDMGLSDELVESIHMSATLHDVGKIHVPAEILSKPSRLNEIEIGLIRIHPEVGYEILKSIDFPYPVARIVLQHHERMDGSGYPTGIKGEDILLEARILAVADIVEAMASHRPFRPSLGIEKALNEISTHRGVLYDAQVVDTCLRLFKKKLFTF